MTKFRGTRPNRRRNPHEPNITARGAESGNQTPAGREGAAQFDVDISLGLGGESRFLPTDSRRLPWPDDPADRPKAADGPDTDAVADVSNVQPDDPPAPIQLDGPHYPAEPQNISEILGLIQISQLVIGTASPQVEPTVTGEGFRSVPFRPDTVIDGWSNDCVTVRGASLRGHYHRYNGAPRQDDFAIHVMPDGRILALVADGVSAAPQSHLGSSTAILYATQWLYANAPADTRDIDWVAMVKVIAWALTEKAQTMLKLDEPDPGVAEQQLATTLVCAIIEVTDDNALRAFIVGIGDSGAWILRNSEFVPVLGGKTDDEHGFSSSAVAGLPRVPNGLEPSIVEIGPGDVLLLGTDGIGDPLGSGQGGVGNLFRDLFGGKEPPSLIEFAHAMDFSRARFDDDRTLVAVIPRHGYEN